MKKFVKAGLMLVLGLALVAPGMTTPADAASKVKVVSTTTIAKKAYHGKKGYIYSSSKLTKKKYKMKNYKYTTWYGTKKATIKKAGKKKASLTYIKAGKKKGWIYSKYLTAGKAPINKAKIFQNDITAYRKVAMLASQDVQGNIWSGGYSGIGSSIDAAWNYSGYGNSDDPAVTNKDRKALLNVYSIFKGRFTKSQNASLDSMSNALKNEQATDDNNDEVATQMGTFASALGDLVSDL